MNKQIIFVDASVENYQSLIQGTAKDAEIVILDAWRNGIEQIAEALANQIGIEAVHIILHGNAGSVRLGNAILNSDTLDRLSVAAVAERLDRKCGYSPL